jgi:hypothetical protein
MSTLDFNTIGSVAAEASSFLTKIRSIANIAAT